jgi:hypothetical protein
MWFLKGFYFNNHFYRVFISFFSFLNQMVVCSKRFRFIFFRISLFIFANLMILLLLIYKWLQKCKSLRHLKTEFIFLFFDIFTKLFQIKYKSRCKIQYVLKWRRIKWKKTKDTFEKKNKKNGGNWSRAQSSIFWSGIWISASGETFSLAKIKALQHFDNKVILNSNDHLPPSGTEKFSRYWWVVVYFIGSFVVIWSKILLSLGHDSHVVVSTSLIGYLKLVLLSADIFSWIWQPCALSTFFLSSIN